MAQSRWLASILPRGLLSGGSSLLGALPGLAPTFVVVALLACVLLPLPTPLVDLLLSVSLAGAVLLLVASLGVRRSADFLNFPTLLLLVTLYRLAINVSTTRLILSQADAGRVVDAFATFVVRGDLIVGGVMFAIISIIQYLVIARGAERVAEVAARFALDGMPGHQQAIEADLRAGLISPQEAARRRARLMERSSFYGAMDGAVRFVKGDAVAGLAIVGVNLVGGLVIGISQMGYTWQDSLQLYGRLTIGDGLLAQIPALLVSLAAGVLVSRVDEGADSPPTGLRWLEPAMLLVPATMLLVLAMVPGMPGLAFFITALALVVGALVLATRIARSRPERPVEAPRMQIRLHPDAIDDARALEQALAELTARCSAALGIKVPRLRLALDPSAPTDRWELRLGDRLLRRTTIADQTMVDVVLLGVFRGIMDHAPALIDLQDLENGLETLRGSHPILVRRALEVIEPTDLLAIVRAFLRERLSRPPLSAILAAVAEDRRFRDTAERHRFAEIAREQLAPYWLPDVLDSVHSLGAPRWVRLTPDAEEALIERTVIGDTGLVLRMPSPERTTWIDRLRETPDGAAPISPTSPATISTLARLGSHASGPLLLLTTPRARPAAAALLAGSAPHVPVLSTQELSQSAVELAPAVEWVDLP
ncbi:MAG: flagellar biosynthesis protein FlhA [Deltaproteobacteria bacterium]|nr:flagellar biosynthesis protein FlhA [Deltaproteobacteria bacterium]